MGVTGPQVGPWGRWYRRQAAKTRTRTDGTTVVQVHLAPLQTQVFICTVGFFYLSNAQLLSAGAEKMDRKMLIQAWGFAW